MLFSLFHGDSIAPSCLAGPLLSSFGGAVQRIPDCGIFKLLAASHFGAHVAIA